MKRSRLGFVLAAAMAALCAKPCTAAPTGRHFKLADGDHKAAPGLVRFLSCSIELAEGTTQKWVTLTRAGNFYDPRYGDFSITLAMLNEMVRNFDARVLGQDVEIDVEHRPSNGSAATIRKLALENGRLRALVDFTPYGVEAVRVRGFKYFSAEFHETWQDNEARKQHGCVLLGAGLTTRPVIKGLDPVKLSEGEHDDDHEIRTWVSPKLLRELSEHSMTHLEQLRAKYKTLGLSEDTTNKLLAEAKKQLDAAGTDQVKLLAAVATWESVGQSVCDQLKSLGQGNPAQPQNVSITLSQPVDVAAEFARLLAERETAAAASATTLANLHKTLSETIAAGDTTLTVDQVKALAEEVHPMVTAVSTVDQVKTLAELQVSNAKKLSAATKLAGLGYIVPNGSLITVDSSNEVNGLQSTLDKRLGLVRTEGDNKRFFATGGKLLAANKEYADKVLAEFDSANGHRLHNEHKMLSAGVGTISDIKVPASVERTVLREMLFNLVSLNFMDVGTAALAPSYMIPYSWRDTTAAGVNNVRRYELQAIQKAGVRQDWDTAFNTPQKLAFQVSNEMQLLLGAGPINFDPIAENVANMIRIVGEDTERVNLNEIVRSADEYGVATITDTLTAQVNGTNKVFVTSQFPVVRPRTQYDLQGNVAVATANPLVVTLNAVVRNEFVLPSDGSALPAGLYYVMDYNLGELRFYNEAGVLQTPTSAWVLTVAYSYTTNMAKFNLDLGSLTVGQLYDNLLTAIGNRKVVIEDDRYFNAGMCLMTGGVNNALGQATTFTANGSRLGTSLNADGSVGVTKGIQTFKPSAPGLMLNDNRIVIGERNNSRFRMAKPFAMGALQEAKNAAGAFIGAKEGYGEQYIVSHTPINRKNAATSLILYSAAGRVARAA
ncbi:phage protease [Variovorax sp. HJSM1_2]|uniref:phage protease n=1 Tax=Variovorax sp. HJSM1_2 TaxID=3366263 RepID=UPI003BE1F3E3